MTLTVEVEYFVSISALNFRTMIEIVTYMISCHPEELCSSKFDRCRVCI